MYRKHWDRWCHAKCHVTAYLWPPRRTGKAADRRYFCSCRIHSNAWGDYSESRNWRGRGGSPRHPRGGREGESVHRVMDGGCPTATVRPGKTTPPLPSIGVSAAPASARWEKKNCDVLRISYTRHACMRNDWMAGDINANSTHFDLLWIYCTTCCRTSKVALNISLTDKPQYWTRGKRWMKYTKATQSYTTVGYIVDEMTYFEVTTLQEYDYYY